jgi:hypothetical protein
MNSRIFQTVLTLFVALTIVVFGVSCAPSNENSKDPRPVDVRPYGADTAEWMWPAASLEVVVAEAHVIVRGRFVRPSDALVIYPDGFDGKCCSEYEGGPGVLFTPVSFRVDKYLKGAGPDELLILQPGDLRRIRGFAFYPEPDYGEETILFALRWDEQANTWHTHHGIWGRVVIRGGAAVLPQDPSEQRPSPYFPGARSLDDVEAAVKRVVE